MPRFSIIIAVYNEADYVGECIKNVRRLGNDCELIIVDGQSRDQTYDLCRLQGANVYRSARGRGLQYNEGVRRATGEILIFLHADTKLPDNALDRLARIFEDQNVQIGTFRLKFDADHWAFRSWSFFTRFDSIWTSFGDQGIVVRREFFNQIGGFPVWPFFEDVHFLRLARKKTKVHSFPGPAVTSARRYLQKGIYRSQWFNAFLIIKYLCGVSPEKMYEEYYDEKIT